MLKSRTVTGILLAAVLLVAIVPPLVFGYLGKLEERANTEALQAKMFQRAAEAAVRIAKTEQARGDSLATVAKKSDSVAKVAVQKSGEAVSRYRALRAQYEADTAWVEDELDISADETIASLEYTVGKLRKSEADKDSVIASRDKTIGFLNNALSERDGQIASLNRRIATDVKRIRAAKVNSFLKGAFIGSSTTAIAFVAR
jgi:hypothetical protein